MTSTQHGHAPEGLSLAPFRALRPTASGDRLARRLSPPYDVITPDDRERLLAGDPDNVVSVILPDGSRGQAGYEEAAEQLAAWVASGAYAVDAAPAIYVYEMRDRNGQATRGLVGALELRAPEDGVILPHENTMAGPVADRLALMTTTAADLEPIYLVYDGGGPASEIVRAVDATTPAVDTTMPDGIRHRLWLVTDVEVHDAIARDLADRRALIADGHHRYATYRERQRRSVAEHGAGAWDRGMALLVDSSDYGPQVHAIHRVLPGVRLDDAASRLRAAGASVGEDAGAADAAVATLADTPGFGMVVTDGRRTIVVTDPDGQLSAAAGRDGEPEELSALDVVVLHRAVVEKALGLADDEQTVGYAHSVAEAVAAAEEGGGVAVLMRATPVEAVAAVAAAGARMPRKSTLFTPKPASGLLMRRFADQN